VSTLIPDAVRPDAKEAGGSQGLSSEDEEISLVGVLNALLRRWRLVLGLPTTAALVTVLLSFVVSPTYTATTTFVPEARNQSRLPSGIAAVAGQVGLSIGTEPSQSPRFYADVVTSRELLERVLLSRYSDPHATDAANDSTTLLRILAVKGRSRPDSLARGVKKLNRLVSVRVDDQTNIVRVSVDAHYPVLAAAVANRLIAYLNEFNTQHRQSQARERRKFTEQRVAAADSELRRAEEAVKTFYERNRGWQQAPELVFEEARLRRQVDVGKEVYLTVKREYETARIEEVNDTPVITVIDPAVPPQEKSKPKRGLLAVLAFALGSVVAVLCALGAEGLDKRRLNEDDEYREFRTLLRRARGDVGHGLSSILRRGR
jgi:tyrosine-protein kinase Etk/Wzc